MSELTLTNKFLTEKDCYKILKKHCEDKVRIINSEITKADSAVIGFLGDHFRLKIVYQSDSNQEIEEVDFFVKTEPRYNATQGDYVKEMGVFRKESSLYENVLWKLSAIAGIYIAPKSYLIKKNCLVFEDLRVRNFKMPSYYLNLNECESLVICLAKFHSASIVYEEFFSTKKEKFRINSKFKEEIQENAFSFIEGEPRYRWLKNTTQSISDCIRYIPQLKNPEEIVKKLHLFAFNEMPIYLSASSKFRNTITHCDLWRNNIMFDENLECVLVDFQLARYIPPAYDLLLTLFLNTTTDFLEKHMSYLLNIYYETFRKLVLKYDLVGDEVFPLDSFMESVDFYKLPALLEAALFATNIFLSQETLHYIMSDLNRYEEFAFTNRSKYVIREMENNQIFRKSMLEVLIPMIELLMKKD